jgi:hypothetical protein
VTAAAPTKTHTPSKRKIFIRFLRKNGNDAANYAAAPDC